MIIIVYGTCMVSLFLLDTSVGTVGLHEISQNLMSRAHAVKTHRQILESCRYAD